MQCNEYPLVSPLLNSDCMPVITESRCHIAQQLAIDVVDAEQGACLAMFNVYRNRGVCACKATQGRCVHLGACGVSGLCTAIGIRPPASGWMPLCGARARIPGTAVCLFSGPSGLGHGVAQARCPMCNANAPWEGRCGWLQAAAAAAR